ncbi:MAG: sensor histidine kinase [Acidimicrobiales bacterium]
MRTAETRLGELSKELARLRQAFDDLQAAVVISDEQGRIVLRNRRSTELEEAQPTGALVAAATDEVLGAARDNGPTGRTLELHGPPRRSLVLTATPLMVDDRRVGTLAEIDDVTERRRLDSVRRDFIANVSHELRTPVGALGLLAEALTVESDPEVTARLRGRITVEAERAARLVTDLLDLSRLEAEPAGHPERVTVGEIVATAVDRVLALAGRREVTVRAPDLAKAERAGPLPHPGSADGDGYGSDLEGPLGAELYGDIGQLVSAVANLLENAVKYSEPGGEVDLAARTHRGWVEIAVTDRGIGIPARDIERVFERFYRVDRARSRETGGTGLGLSIVRHVATNHGGTVAVDSREGEGSVFTLRLPLGGATSLSR